MKYRVQGPNGEEEIVEAGEGASQIELIQKAQEQIAARTRQPATAEQKVLASLPVRALKGAKDPIDAGAQLMPRALAGLTSGFGLAPNRVSEFFDSEAARVDQGVADSEREYQAARFATGQDGFDGGRMLGNLFSPINAAMAARIPAALSTGGRVATGAVAGGIGGGLQPVTNTSEASFGMQKAGQVGVGALGGAAATPLFGKAIDLVAPRIKAIQARFMDPTLQNARASAEADAAIVSALREVGLDDTQMPAGLRQQLQQQIRDAFRQGMRPDAAALVRKADFDALGMPYMQPQVTRDPAAFSRMMNMRGVELPGADSNPIQTTLAAQNRQITDKVAGFGGLRAGDPTVTGRAVAEALKQSDDSAAAAVRQAYQAARGSADAAVDVPMPGLAQRVGEIVDDFGVGAERNAIPSAVFGRLKSFGFVGDDGMTQRKVFDFESADKLLKQINAHDDGTNASLGALRAAVKDAMTQTTEGDPFAAARQAAAARFRTNERVPALGAVADARGAVELERIGDDFMQKFVFGAKPSDVRRLAETLPGEQREAVRQQVAKRVYEIAFRGNASGDEAVKPKSFQTGLNQIGMEKLRAFFSEPEIEQMQRLVRVAAYINVDPAGATVSRGSNIGGAMFNQLLQVPGLRGAGAVAQAAVQPASRAMAVRSAMNQSIPMRPNLTSEQEADLARLLSFGGIGLGGALAPGP